MTKYSFNSTAKRSLSPAPSQPRPFDLDHQMRLFMVEKRSAGLHPQLSPLPTHSRTPSYNTQKQLPMPPSPPRKLLRLTSKPSKRYNTPTTATYFNSSGRAVSRTEIRPVPRSNGASSSAPSLVSPSEMQRFFDTHQKRPSSFIAPETPNDVFWTSLKTPETALPPRWHTPENSPLLPPPRGNLRTIPPPITIISPSPPKRRGGSGTTPQLRNKTSEIFESVLGISTTTTSKKHIRGNELAPPQTVNGISPRRITIDSIERPPRTPPAPPTPAKSRAQRERARAPIPAGTPVGYVAELVGSEVEVPPVELMGDVAFPVIMAPAPKKRVKASKVKSKVKQRKPQTPEGREIYARLPLPDVPITTTTTTTTTSVTPPGSPRWSCGSSPVLEVDLECFEDGLVEWFNNFNWSEAIQVSPTESVSTTPTTATIQTPTEFVHDTRASVVDPDGAVVTGEQKVPVAAAAAATTSFLVSPSLTPQETALLSPVFPVSPRLASYYGARASFASSVGDAFRFDEEAGEGLSDVDERYEEEELDVDEMYGFGREGEDGGEVGEVEEGQVGEGDRTSLDSRLEFEIEMILNGSYGGGSPDDWRDGIYSAGEESPDLEDVVAGYWGEEGEGEIMVGLDIDGVWGEREEGRPKTRYIAGRNSAIEGDVVFCLRGVDSM